MGLADYERRSGRRRERSRTPLSCVDGPPEPAPSEQRGSLLGGRAAEPWQRAGLRVTVELTEKGESVADDWKYAGLMELTPSAMDPREALEFIKDAVDKEGADEREA